jgi:hypothetical protein
LESIDEAATKWIEANDISMEDFNESAAQIVNEVIMHSEKNRVAPIVDPSMAADPMGNG